VRRRLTDLLLNWVRGGMREFLRAGLVEEGQRLYAVTKAGAACIAEE